MKIVMLSAALVLVVFLTNAQAKRTILKPANPVSEDTTQYHKIIPAEIPQPILDSLQTRNFGMQDVYTAHRNGNNTVYVIEIAHDIVREVFWFNAQGRQLRPSARKGDN